IWCCRGSNSPDRQRGKIDRCPSTAVTMAVAPLAVTMAVMVVVMSRRTGIDRFCRVADRDYWSRDSTRFLHKC
ncbi:MAG: hypothetical protein WAO13_23495, partial [Pseudolabrys sp.]